MIKILHIVPTLSVNSGMMSVVLNYHKHIDRSKVQFDYMYFYDSDLNYIDMIKSLDANTYHIGPPELSLKYLKKIDYFFANHIGEYFAIHCHPIFAANIFAKSAKKYGIKHIIAHSHSTKFSEKRISALRNYILSMFIRCFATDFIACSKEATRLFGNFVKEKDCFILHNAIDSYKYIYNSEQRNIIRSLYNISENETVIGHIGRFSKEKNHSFLIDIFNKYIKLNPNSRLLLVGDGNLINEIREKIKNLNLTDKVILTGSRSDIQALLSAMDIFVFPSYFEGVPVSVVEAQASGLPCILSTNITREVGFSNSYFIPLSLTANYWAKKIYEIKINQQRDKGILDIINNGYEITHEAINLQNYYLTMGSK